MEYVSGVPINTFCDQHRLLNRERLALFMQVCRGIQHAHQKGVIHRDIKPGNILVAMQDGRGVPKIIDFGVAKATSDKLTEQTYMTEARQFVGTLEYTSPEQIGLEGLDVDTRADVYSLGVVLYQLLVGTLPFEPGELRRSGYDAARQTIRDKEPPRPSARLSTLGEHTTVEAERRHTDPRSLMRQLRGDLDWITMRAMEKDRSRRYASASELAADIERHLRNEPVLAGAPGALYRLRKFVRRHKLGVAAGAVIGLLLVAGIVGTALGLLRARQAERVARQEAETSRQTLAFLVDLFRVSDPGEARGNTVTAREVLDRGAMKIETELVDQPLARAQLMQTIGEVYRHLGIYEPAEDLLSRSLAIRTSVSGEEDLAVASNLADLSNVQQARGKYDEARTALERSLAIRRRVLGNDHPLVASVLNNMANIALATGGYQEARRLLEEVLVIREAALGPEHSAVADSINSLGAVHFRTGDFRAAIDAWEKALAIRERTLGEDHPFVAQSLNNLSVAYKEIAEYDEARLLLERTIALQEKLLGPDHPHLAAALNNLGELLREIGDYETARPHYERALAIAERAVGPDHAEYARYLKNLAELHRQTKDYEAAQPLFERALAIREAALGPDHLDTAWSLIGLGGLYEDWRRYDEAKAAYGRAAAIYAKVLGPDHSHTAWAEASLADIRYRQKDRAGAEAIYLRILPVLENTYGQKHYRIFNIRFNLGCLAAVRGAREEALTYLRAAIDGGLAPDRLTKDPDLDSLRGDPEFEALFDRGAASAADGVE
jgi:non-specific serine/threonine protein kinase/serine/threonine-protein kinase